MMVYFLPGHCSVGALVRYGVRGEDITAAPVSHCPPLIGGDGVGGVQGAFDQIKLF